MVLRDEHNGFTISLNYDGDGFPIVLIHTGGGFTDEKNRPAVEVTLNGKVIHEMFKSSTGDETNAELAS